MQSCFSGNFLRPFVLVLVTLLPLHVGCDKATANAKGIALPMQTHYIGRFSIAVPIDMKQAAREHKLRHVEIEEVSWPQNEATKRRKETWDHFIAEVKKLRAPKGADKVIMKRHDFAGVGEWTQGCFYHDQSDDKEEGTWKVIMNIGQMGVWLKGGPTLVEDENREQRVAKNLANLGKSYHVLAHNATRSKGDWFYLQYGAIKLPYDEQESSYARFEGHPLDLKLEIKMNETYKVEPGLIERTNSGLKNILGKYVAGISVDRLRSRKREAAGLAGEEEILRMSDKDGKELYFHWEYAGKEDSGENPEIQIKMSSADGNLEEKLKIWDAVLNSMQPMYK